MRYVAIGDSFTEGMGDERSDGTPRGWADLAAQGLAVGAADPLRYANLAVRGRLLGAIIDEQLEPALAMGPTLLTLNGGGNDVMRSGATLDTLVGLTEQAVLRCAEQGVRLVLLSGADPSQHLPAGRVIHRRGQRLAAEVSRLCRAHGVTYVDNWSDAELRRSAYWSADRLHLNRSGHRRVAARLLAALGADAPAAWSRPSTEPDRSDGVGSTLRYYRDHVVPWARRRLAGRSSGDGRDPKHADWITLPTDAPWPPPE